MSSVLTTATSSPSWFLIGAGLCVIFGAAAATLILSKTTKSAQHSKVHDPYKTTAFMIKGTLGKEEIFDTVINSAVRFDKPLSKEVVMELFKKHILPFQQFHCVPTIFPADSSNVVWQALPGDGKLDISKLFFEHTSTSPAQTISILERIANDSPAIRRDHGTTLPWFRVSLINENFSSSSSNGNPQQQQQQ